MAYKFKPLSLVDLGETRGLAGEHPPMTGETPWWQTADKIGQIENGEHGVTNIVAQVHPGEQWEYAIVSWSFGEPTLVATLRDGEMVGQDSVSGSNGTVKQNYGTVTEPDWR